LNAADAVNTRSFSLSGRAQNLTINGLSMNKNVINESIPLNAIEGWEINNMMGMDHNFHIHATHFQIIERNGSSATVAENEKGFKDTVFIPANESIKLIIKMIDYTDSKNPYMYHCHILEHEDLGMMGQFVVV
jgi:FtsP/CotA-like multicopper oxidase with cupredoxin domain